MGVISILATFIATLFGGLIGIKFRTKLHLILGFTAGTMLAVVFFEVLPEIIELSTQLKVFLSLPMALILVGFMLLHILEKFVLLHHTNEDNYKAHTHPNLGVVASSALLLHSFFDGVGIGLAFKVSDSVGLLVALAIISHDFSDGINTVSLMLTHKNKLNKTFKMLIFASLAPVFGGFFTYFFNVSPMVLLAYFSLFAGSLLYISTSEILPEAHRQGSSIKVLLMTVLGITLIYCVSLVAR